MGQREPRLASIPPDDVSQYLALLAAADDPVHAEYPGSYDADAIRSGQQRFERFASALVEALDTPCDSETWPLIQDASFVGQITMPPELLVSDYLVQVRVSQFGSFLAVYDWDDALSPETLATIKEVAQEHGYVWMPSAVLNLPYTGGNPGVTGFRSWGERFFDWI